MTRDEPKVVCIPTPPRLDPEDSGAKHLSDTDIANARRFIQQHGDSVRWTPERGWFVWDGRCWQLDDLGRVMVKARETVETIFDEIRKANDKDAIFRWAKRSQSAKAIKDMLYLSRSDPRITARLADFDADPWILNCKNGVINLRTGELRDHDAGLLCSRLVPVVYEPDAQADRWRAFLDRITDYDDNLKYFLQLAVGYSLTGSTREQCLLFCYGTGANGKTVLLETLQHLFGDYGLNSRTETIMARRESGIPNDVARLAGARLVAINETADNQRLNEPLVKDMTGGDTMTARFLHREYFDFRPMFKLWLRGNHKPTIRGTDEGIWRRIRLIPFTVTISDAERDPDLVEKLAEQLPGILAWAVQGCLEWQRQGLVVPPVVTDAVKAYRSEMDIVGQFVEDRCSLTRRAQVTAKALYAAYRKWAEESGEHAVNQRRFGLAMVERGFNKSKERGGIVYHGIELPAPVHWNDDL